MARCGLTCEQCDYTCFSSSDEDSDIESSELIKISCRIENVGMNWKSGCIKLASHRSLYISPPQDQSNDSEGKTRYLFNLIHWSYTMQLDIFHNMTFPLLEDVVNGLNSLILIYGTKNTTKENVLFGADKDPGLIPKSIQSLCNSIQFTQAKRFNIVPDQVNSFKILSDKQAQLARETEQKRKIKAARLRKQVPMYKLAFLNFGIYVDIDPTYVYTIFLSYVHIYKNTIYDLLNETGKLADGKVLKKDSTGSVYIDDVLEVEIRTPIDAYELLSIGHRLKQVYRGVIGDDFAKGHSVYNIKVVLLKKGSRDITTLKCGNLSIVDLCGWEKSNINRDDDENLKEIIALQNCLKIAKNNYRNSNKLTFPRSEYNLVSLLSSYFKRYTKTKVLLCMNPGMQTHEELLETLGFADARTETKTKQISRYAKPLPTWPIIYKDERVPAQNMVLQNIKSPETCNVGVSATVVRKDFKNVVASNEMIRNLLEALHTQKNVTDNIDSVRLKNSFRSHLIALRKQSVRNKERMREKRLMRKAPNLVNATKRYEKSSCFQKPTIHSFYIPLEEHLSNLRKMLDWRVNMEIHNQRIILANFKLAEKLTIANIRSIINNCDITDVQRKIQQSLQDLTGREQKGRTTSASETKSKKKHAKKRAYT